MANLSLAAGTANAFAKRYAQQYSPEQQAIVQRTPATPTPGKLTLKDHIANWKQNPSDENTSALLKAADSSISSALHTYAPGMEDQLRVRAAKMALETFKAYDPRMGTEPSTLLFHSMKKLSRVAGQRGNIIPESEGVVLDRNKINDASTRFEDDHGREPSLQELADLTHLSKKRIESVMTGRTVISETASLAEDSDKDTFLKKDVTDDDYYEYVYASASPIDQKIMEWSRGKNKAPLSNNEIAKRLKMSPAAVSQRKNKIDMLMSDVRSLL